MIDFMSWISYTWTWQWHIGKTVLPGYNLSTFIIVSFNSHFLNVFWALKNNKNYQLCFMLTTWVFVFPSWNLIILFVNDLPLFPTFYQFHIQRAVHGYPIQIFFPHESHVRGHIVLQCPELRKLQDKFSWILMYFGNERDYLLHFSKKNLEITY